MSVRVKFDQFTNIKEPTFVLATRNGTKLGVVLAYNIVFKDYLNKPSEISFRVSKYDNGVLYPLWDEIKDFKTLWCREWDLWFEITVEIDEGDETVKNVMGKTLCEAELSQVNLYDIEINTEDDIARDDYDLPTVFYRPGSEHKEASLLDRLMEKTPHYSLNHVDSTLCDIQKTFQFNDISLYDAFQKIAEEVGCLFLFDSGSDANAIVKRKISVYDLYSNCDNCGYRGAFTGKCPKCGSTSFTEGYGDDTGIFVSVDNLADDITYSTNSEAVKNCFKLIAGDDLMTATVRNCNPNGTDYLWRISDSVKADMPGSLKDKIEDYDDLYAYYQNEHEITIDTSSDSGVGKQFNELVRKYEDYIEDIQSVSSPIVGFPALMNVYYDAVDMKQFLKSEFMPAPEPSGTTATAEAEKLTHLSSVAVTASLTNLPVKTANNAVLAYAKALVHPNYEVSLKNTTEGSTTYPYLEISGSSLIWHGAFHVENKYDETDDADTQVRDVTITNSMDTYYSQKISKMLSDRSTNNIDIVDIFSHELEADLDENSSDESFEDILKLYCLDSLSGFYDACQSVLDILIEQGASQKSTDASSAYKTLYEPYRKKLNAIKNEMSLRETEISKAENLQNFVIDERDSIQTALNFEEYLGTTLWKEFCAYRREDTYSNKNYISDGLNNSELFKKAMEFIEVANNEIYKSSELQHSISGNLRNLLAMKEFEGLTDKFEVGNFLHIEADSDIYRLRLLQYEVDFDSLEKINVDFSDIMKVVDGVSDVRDVLEQAASMATSYDYIARQAEQGADGSKRVNNWVEKGFKLTNTFISNADNQEVVLDNHGLLMKEYYPITDNYSDKQVRIINKGVYITDDGWDSTRTAIGNFVYYDPDSGNNKEAYGVIADTLVGNLILGENVGIYTSESSITLNKDGFIITNEGKTDVSNPITLTMDPNASNPTSDALFSITRKVTNSVDNILKVSASGELVIGNNKFIVDSSGNATIQNITMGGNITWNSSSNPVKILYIQSSTPSSITKPPDYGEADWQAYSSYPSSSSSTWHKTVSNNDFYGSYSYDGGQTWGAVVKIKGEDGQPGQPGSDAHVPGYIQSTHIDFSGIEAPSIMGNLIMGGEVTGGKFIGGEYWNSIESAYVVVGTSTGSHGDFGLYAYDSDTRQSSLKYQIYEDLTIMSFRAYGTPFMASTGGNTYLYNTWNFTNATITGLNITFG